MGQDNSADGMISRLATIESTITPQMTRTRPILVVNSAPAMLAGTPMIATMDAIVAADSGDSVVCKVPAKVTKGTIHARIANSSHTCTAYPATYRIVSRDWKTEVQWAVAVTSLEEVTAT